MSDKISGTVSLTDRETSLELLTAIKKNIGDGKSRSEPTLSERAALNEYIIEREIDPWILMHHKIQSTELRQCISSMVNNIVGFGWRLVEVPDAVNGVDEDVIKAERSEFEELIKTWNYDHLKSFTSLRRESWEDLEETGGTWWEIIRNSRNKVVSIKHLRNYSMGLSSVLSEPVRIAVKRAVGVGKERRISTSYHWRRLRNSVELQVSYSGESKEHEVYYKEFGDPRTIDKLTGEVLTKAEIKRRNLKPHDFANEVIHMTIPSGLTKYGLPRYYGAILSSLGARRSEEINYQTFSRNNIPSLIITSSNGAITDDSIRRMKSFSESVFQGKASYSKMLVIESEGNGDEDNPATAKIDITQLKSAQHTDELFQNYIKNAENKIRRSFNLPPILVGKADDYSRSTAETSLKLAESQIFAPERDESDVIINSLLAASGMKYHTFVTNTPNVNDESVMTRIIEAGERSGAITPRIARALLERTVNESFGDLPDGIEHDVPFSAQMAELVKNQAKPNEVGQMVTAQKSISKSVEREPEPIVINLGKQAYDIASTTLPAFLSPIKLRLSGRDIYVSDGETIIGHVDFGVEFLIDKTEIEKFYPEINDMFPDINGIIGYEVKRFTKIIPISYIHPDGKIFATNVDEIQ